MEESSQSACQSAISLPSTLPKLPIEIKPPALDDQHEYHVYLACSDNDAEERWTKDLGVDVLEKMYGFKCLIKDRDAQSQNVQYTIEALEKMVQKARRVILIMTDNFLRDNWNKFEQILGLMKTFDTDSQILIPVKLGHLTVDIPERLGWLNYIDFKGQDFMERLLKALTDADIPINSLLPAGNIGYGLAWSYYYGYLALILPGLEQRIINWIMKSEEEERNTQFKYFAKKLIICIPESGFSPSSFNDADSRITHAGHLEEFTRNRAGNIKRSYRNNVYQVKISEDEVYYMAAEYATPILTMYEMEMGQIAGLNTKEKLKQIQVFYRTLNEILSHGHAKDCNGAYVLVHYNDQRVDGENAPYPLADKLAEIIKRELGRDEA